MSSRVHAYLWDRERRCADDRVAKVKPDNAPLFESDITLVCENCSKIDIAFMVRYAHEAMSDRRSYKIGTFQEIRAKRNECQLCQAWLQLLPKLDGIAHGEYSEDSSLDLYTSPSFTKGTFDLLQRSVPWDDKSLHTVRLYIYDHINHKGGPEFTITVNGGSFYLNRDDIRWNEIVSQVDFSLPQQWMKFCRENHETCSPAYGSRSESVLNLLRLIDCERTLLTGRVQIIKPDKIPGYAALSYVWGKQLKDDQSVPPSFSDNTGKSIGPYLIIIH
jgi:hypothetical protein